MSEQEEAPNPVNLEDR